MATIIYTCGWVVEGADLPQQEQHRDKKKILKKKTKTVKMLPVKALTRKRLIGSKT